MRPKLKVEKRLITPRWIMLAVSVLSIVLALLAIAFVFIEYGVDPSMPIQKSSSDLSEVSTDCLRQ